MTKKVMAAPTCPDCATPMDAGFLSDSVGLRAVRLAWVEGPASEGALGDVKDVFRAREGLDAFRCAQCGLLKLYVDKSV